MYNEGRPDEMDYDYRPFVGAPNVLEETERGLLVGPEPYLATCERCGARLPMPEMPMKMQAFVRLLKSAVSEHATCSGYAAGETSAHGHLDVLEGRIKPCKGDCPSERWDRAVAR